MSRAKTLDVWIVDGNTVYKEVPYSVVTDWIQQGRLLGDDRIRLSGTEKWGKLASVPALAAFLPRAETHQAGDQAEALQAVASEFSWKKRRDDEDDDVDMIPLIDVSLVLLVFFMMTAAVGAVPGLIDTPEARFKLLTLSSDIYWIGVRPGTGDNPEYSLGQGDETIAAGNANRELILEQLRQAIVKADRPVRVSIRADKRLPYETVRDLTVALEAFKRKGQVVDILAEVSEKEAGP